jgi:hypothetical protein
MAQSNNKYGFWPADPETAPIMWLPIAASQTLTRGDMVILSSGLIAIALANSAELCGVIARDCSGLAASTKVPVYADPDTIFEGIGDADSSAVVAGNYRDIIGATGAMMIDADATTTNVLTMLRSNAADTTSNAYARWHCKIALHAFADVSS